MNPFTIRLSVLLLVVGPLVVLARGCTTAKGVGQDVENAGDNIQRGTD